MKARVEAYGQVRKAEEAIADYGWLKNQLIHLGYGEWETEDFDTEIEEEREKFEELVDAVRDQLDRLGVKEFEIEEVED